MKIREDLKETVCDKVTGVAEKVSNFWERNKHDIINGAALFAVSYGATRFLFDVTGMTNTLDAANKDKIYTQGFEAGQANTIDIITQVNESNQIQLPKN